MKKASFTMLAMLLIIQVLFSPLTIFAENDPLSTPPAASEDAAGSELDNDDADSQDKTDESEALDEDRTGDDETSGEGTTDVDVIMPFNIGILSVADMSADVQMSFVGLTLNGQVITEAADLEHYTGASPKKGDAVYLAYRFMIEEASMDYSAGSSFTFSLPAHMIEEFNPGSFSGSYSTGTEGTPDWFAYHYVYDSATKIVTVTLISELEESRQEQINFTFHAKFGDFADESQLEQDLIIPINGGASVTLPFQFTPTITGSQITKSAGAFSRNNDGKVTIPWTIWVNTAGKKLEDAELNDATDGKHGLIGSITVEQFQVGLNGINTATPGTPLATTTEPAFPISLADGYYAYKITYTTEVTANPTQSDETYRNTATLTGEGIPAGTNALASQSVRYGPSLEKSRTGDKYESSWSIKYNWLGQSIDADDAVLTDVMTYSRPQTGTHEIDYSSFKVYRVTLSADGQQAASKTELFEGTDYVRTPTTTLTPKTNGFKLDFSNDATAGKVTAAYLIEYDTKLDGEFVTNDNRGTITNTVTRENNISATATLNLTPGIFVKSGGGGGTIDFVDKTITWTLTITAEQDLYGFVIEDEFTTTDKPGKTWHHQLAQWSSSDTDIFKFSGLPIGISASTTNKAGTSPSTVEDDDFKIEFSNTIPKGTTVTIRYKTEFEIKPNGEVATAYVNTANATWSDSASGTYDAIGSAEYRPATVTINNGYKRVNVNNNTQEMSWRIGVNINKQDLNGATLTDTLGTGHYIPVPSGKVLKDQITITRLNLTSEEGTKSGQPQLPSNKWSITETVSQGKITGFVITFTGLSGSENNQAYLIEYITKDSDDIYGQSTGNLRNYVNDATLATPATGTYHYSATAQISDKANELITKLAQVVPNQDLIHWTVTINASNSMLGNITLKDTPSENQKVLLDTFKKQEIKLNSGGTSQNVGTPMIINPDDILVDEEEGSFSINLGNLDGKGYVITYSTYFLGDGNSGEQVTNEATIGYAGASAGNTSDEGNDSKLFKYSGSDSDASSTKGALQVQKYGVNPLTGVTETLEGIQFQLWNKTGTIKLYEGVTNAAGIVAFENVRYGKYVLKEFNQPSGYLPPSDIDITMRADIDVSIAGGKPYVVNNIENVDLAGACPTYTLTVHNINGQVVAGQEINLVDGNNNIVYTGTTNGSGQVMDINRPGTGGNTVQAGLYTVTNESGTELGKITVSYESGNCDGLIQPLPACPLFTITVEDEQGNPRANVKVTLKTADETIVVTSTTNTEGEITVPSTTPAGTYKLYENQQLLGTVEISYLGGNCEADLDLARVCETFVLTVKDEDGTPKANATVTIKDKNNPNNTVPQPSSQTDAAGKVSVTGLQPGTYIAEVAGQPSVEFEVGTDCAANVQPLPACPTFILTVKDEDGLVAAGTELIITNTLTNATVQATVGSNGQVTFASPTVLGDYELAPGEYSVVIGGTGSYAGKALGTFNVTYTEDCRAEVEKLRACTAFTITVIAPNGTTPKANTAVVVVDAAGVETTYTTNTDGEIVLPTTQEPGEVTVYERNSDGSIGEELGKVYVSYKDDCTATVIKNACPTFTLTVNNGDSTPFSAGIEIDIIDENDVVVATGVTNVNGQIVFNDKNKLQQDEKYTVVVSNSGVVLGEITISYIDEICGTAVQTPANACPVVKVTVNDEDGQPRPNVNVTLKDLTNATVTSATTDGSGAFTVPSTTPAGTYKLYEDKQFIGEVVISYQDGNCEAELKALDIARVCETFTLTVNDEDGKTRANASVTIVNKASELQVAAVTTNANGLATITDLEPGIYEVYDNDRKLGEFSVATDCEAAVQPPIGCPTFVVTLHDEDGLVALGTEVTIKNLDTDQTIVRLVDVKGEVSFLSSLSNAPAGIYEATITSGSEAGKVLGTFAVSYTTDCEAEVVKPRVCTVFEITVIAPDGTTPKSNTRVIVKDSLEVEIFNGSTDGNGKITLPQNQAPGQVTVYEVNGDGSIGEELDQVIITYKNDCQGIVIKNACPTFTLTINNSALEAVTAGVKVTIVDHAGEVVEVGVTDTNGQIIFNDKAKLQQGETYTVLNELGKELGQITVSYIDENCEAAVQVPVNACPVFTLTVQQRNGLPRQGVAIEIRTNTSTTATVVATGTTDVDGKVIIPYTIEPGVYYVYEGKVNLGAINVKNNCNALVKPYVWPDLPVETPEPTPSETPKPAPSEKPEPTPSETPEPTPSEKPGPTPAPEKPKTPELEEIINKIPEIPGITKKPSKPNDAGTKYEIPDVPKTIEELKSDQKKVEKVAKDLREFIAKYEQLSAEEKIIVDGLVDVDDLRGVLSQLPTGAVSQLETGKAGQSNQLPKTGDNISLMIWLFIGSAALMIVLLQLGKRRIEK